MKQMCWRASWVFMLWLCAVGMTAPGVWARTVDVVLPAASEAGVSLAEPWAGQLRATVLVAEVEELLGLPLAEARRAAVQQYLAGTASSLVPHLTETSREILPDGRVRVVMEAEVNRSLLHALLQGVGTVYTRSAPLAYSLQMGNPSSQNSGLANDHEARATATLARLELVGNMVQRAGASVRLTLKNEQGRWHATLTGKDIPQLQATSPSLESVWSAVWGPYFAKTQNQLAGHAVVLQAWGWKGTGGVEELERAMSLWSTAVRGVRLGDVNLRPEGVVAQWTLDVLDVAELRNRLIGYAATRHLEFTLTP